MKRLKNITLLTIFCILILAAFSKVHAASATISSNKTSMSIGDTAKITVSYNAAAWNIQVSGAVSYSDAAVSSNAKNKSNSKTLSFKPSKEGTYSIKLKGDVSDGNTGVTTDLNKTIKITVKGKNSTNNNSDSNSNSSDATLKNLGITPNDFTGFRKAITTYSVSVPKNVSEVKIYADTTNPKATVSGTGSKKLQTGKNTFNVKVTAEDKKTTKIYTLNITRKSEDEASTDATLSNFGIRPKEYDFTGFKSNNTNYTTTVPNNVEKITIYAYASNDKATIGGIGEKNLEDGENKFEVKVTAEDKKTTKVYNLTVTRKGEDEEEDEDEDEVETTTNATGVTNIKVGNYILEPEFDPKVYEYKLNLPDNTQNVNVDVEADEDIEAEVVGNEDLKSGENIITVLVRDTKTDATTTYQIIANVGGVVANSESGQDQQNSGDNNWFMIAIGVIALAIIIIIIFLIKISRSRRYDEEYYDDDEYYDDEDEKYTENLYKEKKMREYERKSYNEKEIYEDEEDPYSMQDIYEEDEDEGYRRRGKYRGKRFKE